MGSPKDFEEVQCAPKGFQRSPRAAKKFSGLQKSAEDFVEILNTPGKFWGLRGGTGAP